MRAPGGLVVLSTTENLTVCWTGPPDDPPDGYYITSHPLIYPSLSPLWLNQSSPGAHWVNESVCVNLGTFTPGQTYEVGVVSLRGKDRSKRTDVKHTTGSRNKDTNPLKDTFTVFFMYFLKQQSSDYKKNGSILFLKDCAGGQIHCPYFVHKCVQRFV